MRIAHVKTVYSDSNVLVPITSETKPNISDEVLNKWQKVLDLAAKIIGVPSGLITKLHEDKLEVFLSSKTEGNIFEQNLKLDLGMGWYCENVAGSRNEQVIPNALKIPEWENNPSVPFNIISYMGMPILWPDGEVFGTFCMLDNKENQYSDLYRELLTSLREIIQNDLRTLQLYEKAKDDIVKRENQLREIHHRIKNHFNLLINTLHLQAALTNNKENVNTIIAEIQSKISAISLIHDKLYNSINLEHVSLIDYLSELGKYIINSLAKTPIKFVCSGDEVKTEANVLVPCGLIINEVITNSLKYAFTEVPSPEIIVKLEKLNENKVRLIYKDNGKGLPADFNIEKTTSLGMTLIIHSTNQLNAGYKIYNDNGFCFEMSFNLK